MDTDPRYDRAHCERIARYLGDCTCGRSATLARVPAALDAFAEPRCAECRRFRRHPCIHCGGRGRVYEER